MERPAARLEWLGHHSLSFSAKDLPSGYGECLDCGALVNLEAWMEAGCKGKAPTPETPGPGAAHPTTPQG